MILANVIVLVLLVSESLSQVPLLDCTFEQCDTGDVCQGGSCFKKCSDKRECPTDQMCNRTEGIAHLVCIDCAALGVECDRTFHCCDQRECRIKVEPAGAIRDFVTSTCV